MESRIALITGCSTGIGRETARQLAQQGWKVFAAARRPVSLQGLVGGAISAIELDVCSAEQLEHCRARIEQEAGRLDLLINNAGYGAMGPLAEMPLSEFHRQLDTNVVAPLALVQSLLPLLQKGRSPLVVNIGSVSGILTTPFSGAYCASKAALHSVSDALRMELAPLGVRVLTVQPGAIRSEFGNSAERGLAATLPEDSRYRAIRSYIQARAQQSQQGGTPTDRFVRELVRTLSVEKPPAVKRIGKGSMLLPTLKRLLPERWIDRILSRKFGLSRLS